MTPGLLAVLAGLAAVDALNPGTIVVCVLLLLTPDPTRRTLGFVAGAFVAYLAGGVAILVGLGDVLAGLRPVPGPVLHWGLVGLGALLLAGGAWLWRRPGRGRLGPVRTPGSRGTFAFGVAWTVSDLPTAAPLLVAVERLADADVGLLAAVVALTGYVTVYVAPLLALVGLRHGLGARGAATLERIRARITAASRPVAIGTLLVTGGGLVVAGGAGLG